MEIEKSQVSIQSLVNFRQSGDVLFFLHAHRLRGYSATTTDVRKLERRFKKETKAKVFLSTKWKLNRVTTLQQQRFFSTIILPRDNVTKARHFDYVSIATPKNITR